MKKYLLQQLLWIGSFLGVSLFPALHAKEAKLDSDVLLPAPQKEALSFIENKGQWHPEVKYKAEIPGGALFLTGKGFVYNYASEQDMLRIYTKRHQTNKIDAEALINYHAYKVSFLHANIAETFECLEKRTNYNNYFVGNDSSKWAAGVRLFGKVIQKNVYEGIDLAIYSHGFSLKYDFIVAPGNDPGQIALSYEGAETRLSENGNLIIKTSVNEVIEEAPYSYQLIGGKEVFVKSYFKLTDNLLSFEFPDGYDPRYALVIDPKLVFATFSGATSSDVYAYASTYDNSGNLYAGADAHSPGWPLTTGAVQATYGGGGHEMGINKYNAGGTALIYSTYFGGSGFDLPHAMKVNDQNELVVAGSTSSTDMPTTTGGYAKAMGGGLWDMFVVHFNSAGTALLGSTFIGGSSVDPLQFNMTGVSLTGSNEGVANSPMELDFDKVGNIWVAGNTSSANFPVTANAFQPVLGGAVDGVLFQLNAECSRLLYSSYFGGSGHDGPTALVINHAGALVIGGITGSPDFPTTSGVLLPKAPGGTFDGFVAIFNPVTGKLVSSTYIGTEHTDHVVSIQIDKSDNIYALGRTLGNYPISPNVWRSSDDGDCFIDKLNPTLTASLSATRLGNPQSQHRFIPSAFLVDICDHVYVAGFFAAKNLPLSADAYQTQAASFWFCVMKPGFEDLKYGTYFGSSTDHNHVGANRMDPSGTVYHSMCKNERFPGIPPGVWAPERRTQFQQDVFSFKFAFGATGVISRFELDPLVNSNDSGCAPYKVAFLNHSIALKECTWDFGDGSPLSGDRNAGHTFEKPGTYRVTLYARNDTTCNRVDTATMTIVVVGVDTPDINISGVTLCNFNSAVPVTVTVNNPGNNSFEWGPLPGISGDNNKANIIVNPFVHDTYYVTVTNSIAGICRRSISDTIKIDRSFIDLIPQLIVAPACKDASNGGARLMFPSDTHSYKMEWRRIADTTILSYSDSLTGVGPGDYQLFLAAPNGCDTTFYFTIRSLEDQVAFAVSDTIICEGSVVSFINNSEAHYNKYKWFLDGQKVDTQVNSQYLFPYSGTYEVMLTGQGRFCGDTARLNITVDARVAALSYSHAPDEICVGEQITFIPEKNSSVVMLGWKIRNDTRWEKGISTRYLHAFDADGVFPVTLIARFRTCPDIHYTDTVTVHPLPLVTLGADRGLCLKGKSFYLKNLEPVPSIAHQYLWSTGDTGNALKVTYPGRYALTVINDPLGCSSTDEIDIHVDCYVDVPNAFSPNGDGSNDYFFPRQLLSENVRQFNLKIFNRWGQQLYETSRIDGRGWDGRFNDVEQAVGVYVYSIRVMFGNDQQEYYEGNITLLR